MADINQAIEYAKQNPNSAFATELRGRIESGKLNTELTSAGLTQYIPAAKAPEKKNIVERTVDNVKEAVKNPKVLLDRFAEATGTDKPLVNQQTDGTFKLDKTQAQKIIDTTAGTVGADGVVQPVKKAVSTIAHTIDDATESFGASIRKEVKNVTKKIEAPSVSDATKVSLNPEKALEGTGQDVTVSIGGKLKQLSKLTPEEKLAMQSETEKHLEDFTKQAELFSKDRAVKGGSPVEIVGSRTDKALDIADKQRQTIGKQMGDIEQKYVDTALPISEETMKPFVDALKSFDNPKYGVETADAPIVRKLIGDFDALQTNGATVGERLEFIRSWDKYLRDAKDGFGNFKENASTNTKIQNAVRTLKEETVDAVAQTDKQYATLRKQYAGYKRLAEYGDQLLGKDGALGERVKGAATIKRAIQSNSDAGARQFLTQLKNLTGYDAIKEGDIALTAMENVGDYQGLSLLELVKEGKTGIINRALEKAQDLVVGDKASRVKKFIQSDVKKKINSADTELLTKAKNYKTADDFIEGEGNYYSGVRDGEGSPKNLFITPDKARASEYGKVEKQLLKKDASIADIKADTAFPFFHEGKLDVAAPSELKDVMEQVAQEISDAHKGSKTVPLSSILQDERVMAAAKEAGYDGFKYRSMTQSGDFDAIQVFNKEKLLTKAQLNDLYKKAKGKK